MPRSLAQNVVWHTYFKSTLHLRCSTYSCSLFHNYISNLKDLYWSTITIKLAVGTVGNQGWIKQYANANAVHLVLNKYHTNWNTSRLPRWLTQDQLNRHYEWTSAIYICNTRTQQILYGACSTLTFPKGKTINMDTLMLWLNWTIFKTV